MSIVGYIRVSTHDQAVGELSLGNQKARIIAYAKAKGLIGDEGDMEVLEEVASAKNANRPELKKLIKAVEEDGITDIVVYKLDRMFRSTADALRITTYFNEMGVRFHSVCESLDTKSAMGEFFFTILAAVAQMERRVIAERTAEVLSHLRESGHVYGPVPYGFARKGDKLIPDAREQRVLRVMREMREAGASYAEIADHLNGLDIQPKRGKMWYSSTVHYILTAVKRHRKEA